MGFILFILFLLLVFCLVFTLVKKGRFSRYAKIFRIISVILGVGIFGFWFVQSSISRYLKDSLSAQIINKLPQPLDFYIIKIEKNADQIPKYKIEHLGKIRSDYFRLEYLQMQKSNEFWIVGYLGKENLVYFSQHSVPNKNIDQIIEVNNYLIQSEKLAKIADSEVEINGQKEVIIGIWITLDLLLLFLNLVLLFRRK